MNSRDEYMAQVTIGERAPHNATIQLCEYDPNWALLFEREKERVRNLLGDKALQIEHVGSTSVPGLCAKPIIDILLVVADSSDEAAYVPMLEAAGYVLRIREPDWYQHRMFKGPETDIHLHVFSQGVPEIERMLRFRDHLRMHATDREKYADAKRRLAQRTWRHVQDYADAKSGIVEQILSSSESKRGE